jgi:hypothetical protein
MLQLTPELEVSFATVAEKVCDPPLSNVVAAGLMGFTLIPRSGILIDALLVGSVLLLAVMTASFEATGSGAVYVVLVAATDASVPPPPVIVHVTPASAGSLDTVAVNDSDAPPAIAVGVVGLTLTLIEGGGLLPLPFPPPHPANARSANPTQKRRAANRRGWLIIGSNVLMA